jgi:hypothetical protein
MADENKLATFKWFTDTYTCGTLDLGISETIFNYPYYTTSDKVINYKDLINPNDYKGNASISNSTNFVDGENNKCILQSHIKELIDNNERYIFKIGFQKNRLDGGNHLGKDCLYIKLIAYAVNLNIEPPDNKIKIKIIIYESESDNIGTSHTVDIPYAVTQKDFAYIIVPNIYRVEIVGVSVYRTKDLYSDVIIQPHIEYYYTLDLRDYISAANNYDDGNFNGSKITRGGRIETFISNGSTTPGTGNDDNSGDSGDSTQKDLVIQNNWVDLETVVNNQSNLKICWAAVDYIIDNDKILIWNYADIFDEDIYALLFDSADIIKQIRSINPNYNNNHEKCIFVAFEELYNTVSNKNDINELQNYEYFSELPDDIHELQLTGFIDYGDNLIKPDKNE